MESEGRLEWASNEAYRFVHGSQILARCGQDTDSTDDGRSAWYSLLLTPSLPNEGERGKSSAFYIVLSVAS
jgi:hypothetical protein